jgi:hypothetical protein
MKLHIYLDRIYRIIRIYFGLVFLYPVHPVDPVRKSKVYAVKFFIRLNWPLFRPAAGLTPETLPVFKKMCPGAF